MAYLINMLNSRRVYSSDGMLNCTQIWPSNCIEYYIILARSTLWKRKPIRILTWVLLVDNWYISGQLWGRPGNLWFPIYLNSYYLPNYIGSWRNYRNDLKVFYRIKTTGMVADNHRANDFRPGSCITCEPYFKTLENRKSVRFSWFDGYPVNVKVTGVRYQFGGN